MVHRTAEWTAAGRAMKRVTWQRDVFAARRRATIQVGYGSALAALGWPDTAAVQYREALRLDPSHVEAHFNLACVTAGKARLKHIRQVLKGDPRHKLALQMMGGSRRLVVVGADGLAPAGAFKDHDPFCVVFWNGEEVGPSFCGRRPLASYCLFAALDFPLPFFSSKNAFPNTCRLSKHVSPFQTRVAFLNLLSPAGRRDQRQVQDRRTPVGGVLSALGRAAAPVTKKDPENPLRSRSRCSVRSIRVG